MSNNINLKNKLLMLLSIFLYYAAIKVASDINDQKCIRSYCLKMISQKVQVFCHLFGIAEQGRICAIVY